MTGERQVRRRASIGASELASPHARTGASGTRRRSERYGAAARPSSGPWRDGASGSPIERPSWSHRSSQGNGCSRGAALTRSSRIGGSSMPGSCGIRREGATWVLDPLAFDQIVGWSKGEQHDGRPILRLTHHPLTRITWVPARRFLWWTWGNAVGPVVETTTTLAFGKRTNSVLRAIGAELDGRNVPEGPSFVVRPAGTRAERTKESRGPLAVYRRSGRTDHLRHRATLFFFLGGLAWPLRLLSWIVVAALAWLASPWLVLPAIVASELVWLAVMRRSMHGRRTGPHRGCGSERIIRCRR